jgi:hypothetical protein
VIWKQLFVMHLSLKQDIHLPRAGGLVTPRPEIVQPAINQRRSALIRPGKSVPRGRRRPSPVSINGERDPAGRSSIDRCSRGSQRWYESTKKDRPGGRPLPPCRPTTIAGCDQTRVLVSSTAFFAHNAPCGLFMIVQGNYHRVALCPLVPHAYYCRKLRVLRTIEWHQ